MNLQDFNLVVCLKLLLHVGPSYVGVTWSFFVIGHMYLNGVHYVVGCGSKNIHHKDTCLKEVRLHPQIF